jgi:carbamoyl-phosphate synthase small subunit
MEAPLMPDGTAILVLEDGAIFEGRSFGAAGTVTGEVVFSTAMTGYQEMLTDPSYAGQLLTLTYPLIGNYGIAEEDWESRRIQAGGFVVHHLASAPSNWRSRETLEAFLQRHGIPAVCGVDTRALTRHLRTAGVMMGCLTTELDSGGALARLRTAPRYGEVDYVRAVSTDEPYVWPATSGVRERPLRVGLLDCGVKFNILRNLASFGCETTVLPCTLPAEAVLEHDFDGVAISPGPGDPRQLSYMVETVRRLAREKPLFGICLGNQLVGHAFGGTTFKLPFGHRGGNHPVKDLATGRVNITSQNHGYAVSAEGLENSGLEVSQINLNDGTVEGLRHRDLPLFTIQYHPEASPGPHDTRHLFERFIEAMETGRTPPLKVDA